MKAELVDGIAAILFLAIVVATCSPKAEAAAQHEMVSPALCGEEGEMVEIVGRAPGNIMLATGWLQNGGKAYLFVNPTSRDLIIVQPVDGYYCAVYGHRFVSFQVLKGAAMKLLVD